MLLPVALPHSLTINEQEVGTEAQVGGNVAVELVLQSLVAVMHRELTSGRW